MPNCMLLSSSGNLPSHVVEIYGRSKSLFYTLTHNSTKRKERNKEAMSQDPDSSRMMMMMMMVGF